MKPDLDAIAYVLTQAEKSKSAWGRVAIENHRRQRNAIEAKHKAARLAGQAAREFGLTVEGGSR